jgi:hypothetical protein
MTDRATTDARRGRLGTTPPGVRWRPCVCAVFCLAAMLCAGGSAAADSVSASALKAAFLFNFAKFVQWPADVLPSGAPLTFCITADDQVAQAIEDTVRDHPIDGHKVTVRRVKLDAASSCHLLYVAGVSAKQAADLIRMLSNTPTLTVSDGAAFAESGGTANFFVEDQKMRFAINPEAAERARLRVSSKLLSLAKLVKDERNVGRN